MLVVVGGERDEVLEPEDAVEGARPHDLGLLRVVRDGEVVGVLGHVLQQSAEGGRAAVLVYLEVGLSECQCIACCRGVIMCDNISDLNKDEVDLNKYDREGEELVA